MSDLVETSEARWFKITVFVISGFFVGFSIANIIYFNRIRMNNGGGGVTRGEATSMLWINAILFAISLIIFIWSIFRLVAGREYRQRVSQYLSEPGDGFVETSNTGVPVPRLKSQKRTVTRVTTTTDPAPRNVPIRGTVAQRPIRRASPPVPNQSS